MKFMDQATQNTHMQFTYIFEGHNYCKAAIWHNFRNNYLFQAVARSTLQYMTPFTYMQFKQKMNHFLESVTTSGHCITEI